MFCVIRIGNCNRISKIIYSGENVRNVCENAKATISVADPDPLDPYVFAFWILSSSSKNNRKNIDFYCFIVTSL
jgi:hypothetical protein